MVRGMKIFLVAIVFFVSGACATSYKAKPLPLKTPASYPNAIEVAGVLVGAQAFVEPKEAKEAFGFDVRGAGMLPVQVVFDNQGSHSLEINSAQTFLEDKEGNLWPILPREIAYERATRYARTKQIFKEGAYHGLLGTAAGAVIGAAVGIVTGENVVETAGEGAAAGAAAGATLGGAKGYGSGDARRAVTNDLQRKSLQNKPIDPKNITFGFIFFPGEARSAKQLRLQLVETDTGRIHVVKLKL
jgi:hypothetical protein